MWCWLTEEFNGWGKLINVVQFQGSNWQNLQFQGGNWLFTHLLFLWEFVWHVFGCTFSTPFSRLNASSTVIIISNKIQCLCWHSFQSMVGCRIRKTKQTLSWWTYCNMLRLKLKISLFICLLFIQEVGHSPCGSNSTIYAVSTGWVPETQGPSNILWLLKAKKNIFFLSKYVWKSSSQRAKFLVCNMCNCCKIRKKWEIDRYKYRVTQCLVFFV